MSRASQRLWLATGLLLLAVFLRLWALDQAPPGMQHDELFKAQEGQAIITQGDIRLFYPSNQGHEGGYVWLIGVAYALLGSNLLMVKLPAFWCGLLTLALLYRVGREVFNFRVAIIALGLAAVSFWMISTNRVGLRANSLPLVTLFAIWGLWRVLYFPPQGRGPSALLILCTGGAIGFAIYTYTASPALYAAIGLLGGWLLVRDHATLRARWRSLALILLLGGALTLPMLDIRLNDPQGANRASTINQPWEDFQDGDPSFMLDNAHRLAGMFAFTGDPEWRYNIPDRPLFWAPIGMLAYAGLLILLIRAWRRPFLILFMGLMVVGLVPSLLTLSAPSYLRSIITLPSVMLAIGIAVDALGRIPGLGRAAWVLGALAIGITGARDADAYFNQWASADPVFAVYRDDLEQLAERSQTLEDELIYASTGYPQTLDPGIYAFASPDPATDV
ncbi:MAG: ArnT family glycosyltransferase, partial [Anaerolineales bacterium]